MPGIVHGHAAGRAGTAAAKHFGPPHLSLPVVAGQEALVAVPSAGNCPKPDIRPSGAARDVAVAPLVDDYGRAVAVAVGRAGAAVSLLHPAHGPVGPTFHQQDVVAARLGKLGSSLLAAVVSERPLKAARYVAVAVIVHSEGIGEHLGSTLQLRDAQHLSGGAHLGNEQARTRPGAGERRAAQRQRPREAAREVGAAIGAGGYSHGPVQFQHG